MPDINQTSTLGEVKISELPVAPSATGTDQLEANQAGVTRSITVAQIAALSPPPDLSDYVTDEELAAIIAGLPPPPVVTVPPGKVAYADPAGALTGDVGFAWNHASQRLGVGTVAPTAALGVVPQANTPALAMSGYTVTGSNTAGAFSIDGALDTTGNPDIFKINFSDTSPGGGAAFLIMRNGVQAIRVSYDGLLACSNGYRFFAPFAVPAPASSWGLFAFNGAGGNLGTYFGAGSPVGIVNTFGRPGSLYYNGAAPGLPYYNSDGATAWDRLVGESATQTLTNKTFAPASISPGSNGQVMTTVSGAAAWAAAGGASITVSDTAPGSPTAGALWWNSVLGTLFLYYNDGNSTQWVPASPSAPNKLLQEVTVETGAVATGTTVIPLDDTIPQITEGDQYMTLAITPQSATSTLVIDVVWIGASNQTGSIVCALFQDATANALAAAVMVQTGADNMSTISFRHKMTSGTTSATTFRVRAGLNGTNTTTFNGRSVTRQLGGVMASSIVIREIAP